MLDLFYLVNKLQNVTSYLAPTLVYETIRNDGAPWYTCIHLLIYLNYSFILRLK